MIKKSIRFDDELIKGIEEYSATNCEGNFNMAVRVLLKQALNLGCRLHVSDENVDLSSLATNDGIIWTKIGNTNNEQT